MAAISIGNNSLTSVNYSSKNKLNGKKNNLDRSILKLTENDRIQFNNCYQRGLTKYEAQDYQSALREFDRAIEINPAHIDAYICRGNVKDKLEDYQGAIVDYNQAIQIDSTNSKAYHSRGNTLRKIGDNWGAITDYNKAIRLNSNYKFSQD
ncbi:tetratricopeptide repeat protein [Okeania sp.]|uniref:tetratricopeptide repeat protein n=1 Tax=Okeania sp. TaxID=3100323 RepID=UPI002B4ADDE4|nr:tetratricopeptide repeat protein [Okeania sp.]MEB3342486.1 tetratricopeptide repeat protein [Okeania sp.]